MSTTTQELTRTVDGAVVPASGTWVIDGSHTSAEFVARHLMVAKVRGGFDSVTGTIEVAEDPAALPRRSRDRYRFCLDCRRRPRWSHQISRLLRRREPPRDEIRVNGSATQRIVLGCSLETSPSRTSPSP